jgi:hypothetical protein
MLVAYMCGDFFSHSARSAVWKYGQSIECQLPSHKAWSVPDKGSDVLLCGDQTQLAWNQTWIKSDIRDQIYANAKIVNVTFHGAGKSHRYSGPSWWCKKLPQGIDCE